ncbi:dynein heavy chain [Thraustotheca clavata]|uniref:Dynein heavy chain n=1 Tax=Thraustotheca clavata TaxID=74557 RepID=A0A1W0AAT9_9STRA|nr:dynein heavy chain [Thraustotheca clavata]
MANARMQWVATRIVESFEPTVALAEVNEFLSSPAVKKMWDDLLAGKDTPKIFVHFQADSVEKGESGKVRLCASTGNSIPIRSKCCYFLRATADGKVVDVAKGSDSTLLYGELAPNVLRDMEATLSQLFAPLFKAREDWGKADPDLKVEFMSESEKFANDLKEALHSMDSGLELRRPDSEYENAGTRGPALSESPQVIAHYEDVLKDWCDMISTYLETNTTSDGKTKDDEIDDDGPMGELEYWRRRMQRLTSITEQLKSNEYKDVFFVLSRTSKNVSDDTKQRIQTLLRRWKQTDISITEATNEAKDNVKYLFTLEKFIVPLYTGTPNTIIDTLPALMNSIKMIHSIARYYNTSERMASLLTKITNQMITNCKNCITGCENFEVMWTKEPEELVRNLDSCLKLNEAYQQQYRATKDKLFSMPKGKQFEFNEMQIFGKFDLFCRRIIKLIDMFTTIHQFSSLGQHKLEGMEELIGKFNGVIREFRLRNHDLLDFRNNRFDRDYVEFNVRISDLEGLLQKFINDSFENITSIEHSLNLLRKFQTILQRENLKSDLDSKFNVIFQNYGLELEHVLQQYERHKHNPPYPRNLPPVAGNITWSRHLLKRIEEPMKKFESNQNVLASKDAKRIIRMYNKVARTLVAFEYIWYQAWVQYIDTAKAGLQATLIIRHPEDNILYVNFDPEILQLLREAKCLDRMGIEIPESAKIVLLQEEKFKNYYNELQFALSEYDRIVTKVIPVTAMLLRPHFNDMEFKLRPGMITLTWTSMNIEAYRNHIHIGLQRLEELVTNINDIIENRVEKNLRIVSKTMLVDLPTDQSFSLEEFVSMQGSNIRRAGALLQGKNIEIENAVEDLLKIISQYPLDSHIESVSTEEAMKLKKHYNHFMYQALLHCTKNSLNSVKKRVASRAGVNLVIAERPFFDVDVQLSIPRVQLYPSLDDIQLAINRAAQTVLAAAKELYDWGQAEIAKEDKTTFFERITKDIEIVRVVLLLTGSVQGLRNSVTEYLESFKQYEWLWMENKDVSYENFLKKNPELQDFERKLKSFVIIDEDITAIPANHNIGALCLNTRNIKLQLKHENAQWKLKYSDNLHNQARKKMESLTEYFRSMMGKLNRKVVDLDSLRFVMNLLKEVRARESGINMEINPVLDMYEMLEYYLPDGFMEKEEMDQKSVLRSNWRKLIHHAETRTDELSKTQAGFKRGLLRDIKEFIVDVKHFREDFLANGPMVIGISASEAVERLNRYKEEYKIRERKQDLYTSGEELFALPKTSYPELEMTKKELQLQDKLFGLYVDVLSTLEEWKTIPWVQVAQNMQAMTEKVDGFSNRCKKMPAKLREWEAYGILKKMIDDFTDILPLLQELSKASIKPRHWDAVMEKTHTSFDVNAADFKLQALMDANIVNYKTEIEEITDGADKQLKIEIALGEINERWDAEEFQFNDWKNRNVPVLKGVVPVVEALEEAQMNLQTMLSMRHVLPFKEVAQQKLEQLSDTSETLERWIKVQMLWCSLESVFTGGDIAKQMPVEAKKFQKIDKDWAKIMTKSVEIKNVVQCCASELLKSCLPTMYAELEKCQKSLEGYLEQKRNKFPRFYFVSNPGLLMILSQGSDPLSMNEHYEKVFDSIERVLHDKKDKTLIHTMISGVDEVRFSSIVKAQGNIEDWLASLLRSMQLTMKDICRHCANDVGAMSADIKRMREFVDRYVAQFALLGIQLMWTNDVQTALEQCRAKKNAMKDMSQKQLQVLTELSSWCLQDLGSKQNRVKIETLVTIHVHQRDVMSDLATLYKQKKISDPNDFEWLKQARFYWRPNNADEFTPDGACVVSITDVDFNYQFEYLGSKERLVVTPLTDRCYITLAQALGMYFGGAPAGPAGTGKTETVKDLGRTLGIYVVVTNCTDQQKYTDCAKIFKGLCQGGLWGCFDEFNRIQLPVLSVVAQQVLAIQNAKKTGTKFFQFPGDPQNILLLPVCGFFITMNPGYAGRQELPENLKALFRGVAMMVPDFEIIMKVKLCSVGYLEYQELAKKFFILYSTCKEQLSAQKHYDWGLRNILAVLRSAGKIKRDNRNDLEAKLLFQTLRDMNLSKLVAQDVPLFLSLLQDLFPTVPPPPKGVYPELEAAVLAEIDKIGLVNHPGWLNKVIQLYETQLVRHGIMLVGPTGGGKSRIFEVLQQALTFTTTINHKQSKLNPKSIRAAEMYGEVDPMSGEWTTGVFAAMWSKYNQKSNKFIMWMICDGPVDAIWIEDLNTVLDDNKILTLANGDRMPMTDNVKLMFEVETLVNASPATVSRAGIVFVSDTDLDWAPVVEAWIRKRPASHQDILRNLFMKYMGENTPLLPGIAFDYLARNTSGVMPVSRVGQASRLYNLMTGLLMGDHGNSLSEDPAVLQKQLEKLFLYCIAWSVGQLLEPEDRVKFDEWLRNLDEQQLMPKLADGNLIYEHFVDPATYEWKIWRPPKWNYPKGEKLDFSNLLVPTMDSVRTLYLIENLHKQKKPVLMVGGLGTAKTSCALMYFNELNPDTMLVKRVNFSSATTPFMFQTAVESELDKRGGKSFGPPNGKKMTIFLDDLSMPLVNAWGDQPTLEIVRLIIECSGFSFLSKDRRGDFKVCEDLQYVGAMGHPGGGRNDIPNRLKRQFFLFNLVLPSLTSIDDIYGQMLTGRFTPDTYAKDAIETAGKLTRATIDLWNYMKAKLLPTPAKFHYIFNMRELSRVFQGVLLTPAETFTSGGGFRVSEGKMDKLDQGQLIIMVWKHECERVFSDKLTNYKDKDIYQAYMRELLHTHFGDEMENKVRVPFYMVNFLRDPAENEDGVVDEVVPKVYEPGGTLEEIRTRVNEFLAKYNNDYPQRMMRLVLFDDALGHLLRLSRLLEMPRGSALLVGVGGSGKQSLTRLAAYMAQSTAFQVTLTKTYNTNSFMDDLRLLYKSAGHLKKSTTFLFTDSEIKNEIFLELLNSVLMTGEVAGLFAKDEMMAMTADLRNTFVKDRPGLPDTQANLKQYFIDGVRDNLHVVLCMSPLNAKFADRARKFPGLISGPTIDWFLTWPEDALIAVSKGFVLDYPMECDDATRLALMTHMGMVHRIVTDLCDEYFQKMRRRVYQTPKSYLSFIESYKKMYTVKIEEIKVKEQRVNLGLKKLIQGAEDVRAMSIVLADEQVKLQKATEETNAMLQSLQVSSAEAYKEGEQVAAIKAKCEEDAVRIGAEKAACETDLAKAKPFVEEAETAIDSIKPAHIGEIKKLAKPADIIRLVFDGVLILFQSQLNTVKQAKLNVAKQDIDFIETSFSPFAQQVMSDSNFLKNVQTFGAVGKDMINEETIELLCPYMELEGFLPAVAKNASLAAEGLCTWVRAMKFYHEASKVVKPKLEALMIAEGQMEAANKALAAAELRLSKCKERLTELQQMFESQMSEKKRIEDGANALARKMQQASDLINGLAGERVRWTDDSNNFADLKRRMVGDCAVACAFVSYCGPFNQDFRNYMVMNKFIPDCEMRSVPVTSDLDIINFLVDIGTIGDWNIQGLPTDSLSIQNGIMVTRSSRYPLLVDPQGQALSWIKNREATRMPSYGSTALNHPKLKDQLEYCMGEGRALVITGVEEDIDPMLDPVLERQIIVKGRSLSINVSDKNMEFNPAFSMYFITRLPNPHFGPELQAKTTVIDFTVTIKGLEEQLLGRVIGKEQKALEEQLAQVLEDVNLNTKSLLALDASLLERLTSNTGNLLEDEELIGVLANTKEKAAEVKDKLIAAADTRKSINEKREQFRPVATRGSVLYFSVVEMSLVNCMYQTSLNQFLALFMKSMDVADKAALASKRVANIIETMTYISYRYINRGLYERDKLTFILLLTMKILVTEGLLTREEVTLLIRGGAALDINTVRRKPFSWISNESWLNVIELSQSCKFYTSLPHDMTSNEAMWRRWYEDNEPENTMIPDYENRIAENEQIGPYLKLLLVRALRMDRTILCTKEFIRNTQQMGPRYVEPVTDTIESIFSEMKADTPVIFLLSIGADPTESIEQLARKRKFPSPAVVSMGEGQEPVALKAINAGVVNGTWVLLQNCELGLELMEQMEDVIFKLSETMDQNFRLFLTALPSDQFPLGLLQMSTKVTNEPPQGLHAGILRSFTVMVDQEKLERVETVQWRQLLFDLCFLHSVVIERKKFGPLGWCIPYEYNNGDLSACTIFLEKHLYNGPISWPTLQYMVSEVQYGGKITDNLDRRMFNYYCEWCLQPDACSPNFSYNPAEPILRIPNDFNYRIPVAENIDDYRNFCHSLPDVDSPEIFGLHPNADLTYRVKEVNLLLGTLGETQPKGGGGSSGISREDVVCEKAKELADRLPEDYIEDDYKAKIQRLGGLTIPLNIFLYQEIQRLQRVISKVRTMLSQLQMAIRGEVVMTEELSGTLDAIFDAKVPPSWLRTSVGDEFSWILPTLGLWFSSLLSRDEQSRTWLNTRRPNCFWLTGFFNPQGMLTAMKQEVTRKHSKTDKWALDDVVYHTEVTTFERAEQVRQPPGEGILIYGLFLDGATWSKQDGTLVESEPKKLFTSLPVLHVNSMSKELEAKSRKELYGSIGPFECPCYKYPMRTDRYIIFMVTMKCPSNRPPRHWGLRGVALLCNTE